MRLLLCAVSIAALAVAADSGAGLLAAAAKGRAAQVKSLLDGGADIEAVDRDGRTALMLAAQHGHLDAVQLLLERGAKPAARDSAGFTAWSLAMFAFEGHGDRAGVLKALPKPPPVPVSLSAAWSPARLASSCFMNRDRLTLAARAFRLDSAALTELARFAKSPQAEGLLELHGATPLGMHPENREDLPEAAAVVSLDIEPGAVCSGQSDSLALTIHVSVTGGHGHGKVLDRSFGGGLKGLRTQLVNNPRQYQPVWESWIKAQAEPIYWAVAAALAHE